MSAGLYEQRIGAMGIFFSVILSEAKACPERSRRDLMPVASGDEILRFAQDDNGKHPQPATSVSATKVSRWLPATLIGVSLAEIAEIPTRDRLSLRRRAAMVLGSQPNVQLALKGGYDDG
jgi:hypothetical protein